MNLSSIQRALDRFTEVDKNTRRLGSDKQRKTTTNDDRLLRNRHFDISILQVPGADMTAWAVPRRLQEVGLKSSADQQVGLLDSHVIR